MTKNDPEFYTPDGDLSTENYRANCYKTVEYMAKALSSVEVSSPERRQLYGTLAVACSNLAIAAAILGRPQPDNGRI